MTGKERVMAAINHQKADRTPADYGAHRDVTEKLMNKLGLDSYEELLRYLHIDMRRISAPIDQPVSDADPEGYKSNMWGVRYKADNPNPNLHTKNVIYPFDENTSLEEIHSHPWPDASLLDFSGVREECERYKGEYALYGSPWSPFFHDIGWIIGQDNFFVWMYTNPDAVTAIIDHIVDYQVEATRRFLEATEGLLDITYFGNDFGTQRGLFISPECWHQFIRQPLKRFYDISHEFNCRVMQHSCGAVADLIPTFVKDGVDILDPIQTVATGMDFKNLVTNHGSQITLHGAIDTQTTLPFGSMKDVRDEVRDYIQFTRERGGYILCGSQEFIEDIPLDNILAMYDPGLR